MKSISNPVDDVLVVCEGYLRDQIFAGISSSELLERTGKGYIVPYGIYNRNRVHFDEMWRLIRKKAFSHGITSTFSNHSGYSFKWIFGSAVDQETDYTYEGIPDKRLSLDEVVHEAMSFVAARELPWYPDVAQDL